MNFKDTLRNLSFDRLRNLPPRDRWLLIGGGAGLLLVLYLSLWLPMQRELSRLRISVPQEKVQLAQMRVQAMEISQLRASGRSGKSAQSRGPSNSRQRLAVGQSRTKAGKCSGCCQ